MTTKELTKRFRKSAEAVEIFQGRLEATERLCTDLSTTVRRQNEDLYVLHRALAGQRNHVVDLAERRGRDLAEARQELDEIRRIVEAVHRTGRGSLVDMVQDLVDAAKAYRDAAKGGAS